MIDPNISGAYYDPSLSIYSRNSEKKAPQVDTKAYQCLALWQRAIVSGALRESIMAPSFQKKSKIEDSSLIAKVGNILFFDTDAEKEKKRQRETKDKNKKKMKSLAELVLLTQNNPSSKRNPFKASKGDSFKLFKYLIIQSILNIRLY
ncbi:MAG: hypothetical protein P4L16_00485 [Chlamydiales bacterium]|nr:hypothetical protein [Chlamydiales bacterium]